MEDGAAVSSIVGIQILDARPGVRKEPIKIGFSDWVPFCPDNEYDEENSDIIIIGTDPDVVVAGWKIQDFVKQDVKYLLLSDMELQ